MEDETELAHQEYDWMVQDALSDIDSQKANIYGGDYNPTGRTTKSGYLGSSSYYEPGEDHDDNY